MCNKSLKVTLFVLYTSNTLSSAIFLLNQSLKRNIITTRLTIEGQIFWTDEIYSCFLSFILSFQHKIITIFWQEFQTSRIHKLQNMLSDVKFIKKITFGKITARCTFEPSSTELLIDPVRATYKDGSNISFSCQMGYTLVGETYLVCYNQSWSGEEPNCYGWCFTSIGYD